MELGRYGLREIMNATFKDFKTKKPFLFMDYGTMAENEWSAEQTYATGGSGAPRRIVWNDSKNSTLTINTQIFSMKHIAMIAGRDIESEVGKKIYKREELTVVDTGTALEVTLSKDPIDQNGDQATDVNDVAVFSFVNGVDGDEVTVSAIDTMTKKLTLTGVNANDTVAVYYQWATTTEAHTLRFTAKDFPKYVEIIGDTVLADEVAGDMVSGQLIYYKAKVQPNFNLSMSPTGDPTELSLVFDLFAERINGEDVMADLTLYDE